jgi:hypothetical protein
MTGWWPPPGMAGRLEQTSGERGDPAGGPNHRLRTHDDRGEPLDRLPRRRNRAGVIARLKARLRRR